MGNSRPRPHVVTNAAASSSVIDAKFADFWQIVPAVEKAKEIRNSKRETALSLSLSLSLSPSLSVFVKAGQASQHGGKPGHPPRMRAHPIRVSFTMCLLLCACFLKS